MKTIEERAHQEYGCVIAGIERTYNESLGNAYIKGAKDQQEIDNNYKELLSMLLEAIDYSFLQTDGTYPKALTYPVIDKVKYIKQVLSLNDKWYEGRR